MLCASCGANNPDAYKHCGTCGAVLVAAPIVPSQTPCANCGALNPDAYKHCGTCGTALEVLPAESYPNDATGQIYTYPNQTRQSSSRRTRMLFVGVLVAGVVMMGCAVCLISGTFIGWSVLGSRTFIASDALRTETPEEGTPSSLSASKESTAAPSPLLNSAGLATRPASSPATPIAPRPTRLSPSIPLPTFAPPVSTGFQKWNTGHVLTAFKIAGLDCADPRPMTKEDYAAVPMVAADALRFFLPILGSTKGGRVYAFATSAQLEQVRKYYLNAKGAALPPWIFVKDNILLQINGELDSDQAVRYLFAVNLLK
jgi:hypothetical protein